MKSFLVLSVVIAIAVAKPSGILAPHIHSLGYSAPIHETVVSGAGLVHHSVAHDAALLHHPIHETYVAEAPAVVHHKSVVADIPTAVSHQHSSVVHHHTPTVVHQESIVEPAFHHGYVAHAAPAVLHHEIAHAAPAVIAHSVPAVLHHEVAHAAPAVVHHELSHVSPAVVHHEVSHPAPAVVHHEVSHAVPAVVHHEVSHGVPAVVHHEVSHGVPSVVHHEVSHGIPSVVHHEVSHAAPAVVHHEVAHAAPAVVHKKITHKEFAHISPSVVHQKISPGFVHHEVAHAAPAVVHQKFAPAVLHHEVAAPAVVHHKSVIADIPTAVSEQHSTVVHKSSPIVVADAPVLHKTVVPAVHHSIVSEPIGVKQTISHQDSAIVHSAAVHHEIPAVHHAVVADVAPLATQYHAQDGLGQYSFGYASPLSSKVEVKTVDGITKGEYNYLDAFGLEQSVKYLSDDVHGFRVAASNLPVGPLPVVDTPEVAAAKAAHLSIHESAKIADAAHKVVHHEVAAVAPIAPSAYSYSFVAQKPVEHTIVHDVVPAVGISHDAFVETKIAPSPLLHKVTLTAAGVPVDTPEVAQAKAAHFAALRAKSHLKEEKPCD